MASFVVNSYKFGLDTRKDVLTSQPGTLLTCENASINPGGEIEKRKAFGDLAANTDVLDSLGAVGTYGLEVTSVGLVAFGSALNFGASVTQSQPTLASALVGVTYQQLKHPSLTNDSTESYNATYHRMTAIVASENFNGNAVAIATFSDGRTFLYYNGSIVQQSANGIVMEGRIAIADLSNDLVRQLTAIGWSADANVDEDAAAQNGSTIVRSPQSDFFAPDVSETSTDGFIGTKSISINGGATSGTKAVASFAVTAIGIFRLQAPNQASATTPVIDLCDGLIQVTGTTTQAAAQLARAVNDFTNVHGYTALSTTNNVFVYAPIGYDIAVAFDLTVTLASGATAGASAGSPPGLSVNLTPDPASFGRGVTSVGTFDVTGTVTAVASGGTSPYTYAWSEAVSGSGNGIVITSGANTAAATFKKSLVGIGARVTGAFKCVATDSTGTPVVLTTYLSVELFTYYTP